jgi:hypothetical protein
MNEIGVSEVLTEMVFKALDHAIDCVRDSGQLIPFLITQSAESEPDAKPKLARFVAGTLEASLAEARKQAATLAPDVKYCVLAYDGYVNIDGNRCDAIMVEGMERGSKAAVCFAQRYKPKKFLQKFATVGNAAFLGDAPPLF